MYFLQHSRPSLLTNKEQHNPLLHKQAQITIKQAESKTKKSNKKNNLISKEEFNNFRVSEITNFLYL